MSAAAAATASRANGAGANRIIPRKRNVIDLSAQDLNDQCDMQIVEMLCARSRSLAHDFPVLNQENLMANAENYSFPSEKFLL
jgi:hypothetical protein